LSLGIEDGGFGHDPDVGFHWVTSRKAKAAGLPDTNHQDAKKNGKAPATKAKCRRDAGVTRGL
jgi:hypothetical protein